MQQAIKAHEFDREAINSNRYLTAAEVEALTGRARATLARDRVKRRGIPYYKMGRIIRYQLKDVLDYIEGCRIETDE
jgi:predicted DNA-binding transcriptional regulator AlpA